MSDPTALDSARTGTPDGTSGIKIPTILMQEDSTFEAPGGIALSDRIAAAPSAHRSAVSTTDTTTDMSTLGFAGTTGANLDSINNRGALVVWCEFSSSTGSGSVNVIYYDSSHNPLFVSAPLSFSALAQRVSSVSDYMSTPQIIETYGASQYRCYVASLTAGNVDVFAVPI